MRTITHFDDLSDEVILGVFDFLSTTDRYHCFFGYNDRLRLLVKNETEFSHPDLHADICRFSTLHNWCKHLTFKHDGSLFYLIPTRGQQPRYIFDTCVTDSNGLHWWFVYQGVEKTILDEQVRAIITRYPLRLNPFFYHRERKSNDQSTSFRWYEGGELILQHRHSHLKRWLNTNYPEYEKDVLSQLDTNSDKHYCSLVPIFDSEWLKALTAIRIATVQIWNELQQLQHINPLDIKFENYFCS